MLGERITQYKVFVIFIFKLTNEMYVSVKCILFNIAYIEKKYYLKTKLYHKNVWMAC